MIEFDSEMKKFLVFLSMFDFGHSKNQQIVDALGDDVSIKHFCKSKFDEKILSKENFEKMKERADETRIKNYYNNLLNDDITLITKYHDNYPQKLKNLNDAPFFLFCKGDLGLLNKPSLAVVGTRKPTPYGRMATERLVKNVAAAGVVIISGLAYGVDSIAHRKCLEVGGKTIAVLGSGLHEVYPAEHQSLADEIARVGLLMSEYSPNKRATKYSFPQRNRILAGLSDGVLITEASMKSGTMHTKDFALDYGKYVYAVPGNIDSVTSELTNEIIKTGQAQCVTEAADILQDYNIESAKSREANHQLSIEEQAIVALLEGGMKDIDYLTKNCGLNISLFNTYLTTLEIRGIIKRLPGGMITLS